MIRRPSGQWTDELYEHRRRPRRSAWPTLKRLYNSLPTTCPEDALVSVLYHALHGARTCEMYALDAEAAGDDELASFFRNVQATHRQVAEQAKTRLYTGHLAMSGSAEVGTSIPPKGMSGPEASPIPRDVRRETSLPKPP